MNVVLVIHKVSVIANSVICKSSLPDFPFTTKNRTKGVGRAAFDQLNGVLKRNVVGRGK